MCDFISCHFHPLVVPCEREQPDAEAQLGVAVPSLGQDFVGEVALPWVGVVVLPLADCVVPVAWIQVRVLGKDDQRPLFFQFFREMDEVPYWYQV